MKKIFAFLALLMVVALVVSVFGSVGSHKIDTGVNNAPDNAPDNGTQTPDEPVANWLFQNEHIGTERCDLPAPVEGVSYTVFVEGVEVGTTEFTFVKSISVNALMFPDYCSLAYDDGWYFYFDPPSGCLTDSGIVSIRING